jgi:hypothetical protein
MVLNMKVHKIRICLPKNRKNLCIVRDQAVGSICSFQGWKGISAYQVGFRRVKRATVAN